MINLSIHLSDFTVISDSFDCSVSESIWIFASAGGLPSAIFTKITDISVSYPEYCICSFPDIPSPAFLPGHCCLTASLRSRLSDHHLTTAVSSFPSLVKMSPKCSNKHHLRCGVCLSPIPACLTLHSTLQSAEPN